MTSTRDLAAFLERARDSAGAHRRLVLVPATQVPTDLAAALPAGCVVVAAHAIGEHRHVMPQHVRSLLGSEHRDAVLDARAGLDLDAFAVLAGTLRGGGLLVLLAPDLTAWTTYADATIARRLSWPFTPNDCAPHFRDRLVGLLRDDPAVGVFPDRPPAPGGHGGTTAATPQDPECATTDQEAAVAAVLKTALGHRRRPSVLTADRGRGKSTALGIAAARLLHRGMTRLLVTAPSRDAAGTLLALAAARADAGDIRFLAPDELLRHHYPADMLFVDEAAGLPAPILETLLTRYSRIAFATTTHGYEGTGHGFRIRFRAALDRLTPQWRDVTLTQPIRWAAGDPLERFTSGALLLDAEPDALPATGPTGHLRTGEIDRRHLTRDDATLRAFFGLLVDAHYQTRPEDIRQALEAPYARLWAVRDDADRILAAAITLDEGGLPPDRAAAISRGERRVRGHLFAQSLAAHAGLTAAVEGRFRRVHRIAVHPGARRGGIGRQLVSAIDEAARRDGRDALATAFGATPELIAFWRGCGLRPVHIGNRRDAASGTHSVFMLRPLRADATTLTRTARHNLAADIAWRLAGPLTHLDHRVTAVLCRELPVSSPDARDCSVARVFADGNRGPDDAGASLQRIVLHALACGHDTALDDTARYLLVGRFLQHQDWPELARTTDLSGRRATIRYLRQAVADLLERAGAHG